MTLGSRVGFLLTRAARSRPRPTATATGAAAGDISNPPDRHRGPTSGVVQNQEKEEE